MGKEVKEPEDQRFAKLYQANEGGLGLGFGGSLGSGVRGRLGVAFLHRYPSQ